MSDSIPEEFLERLKEIVESQFLPQVLESFYQLKRPAFRWNSLSSTNKADVLNSLAEDLIQFQSLDWFEDGYLIPTEQREQLVSSRAAELSQIYVQNPSSLLPCLILDPQPGEEVLDLAAAPGGKTLLMASLMKNEGLISAVEPIRPRFFKLQANLKRYGATLTKTYQTDGRSVGRKVPERFDRVLLDTPCSGESRIHSSNPESFQFWSPRKLKEQSRKQYGLIRSAFQSLRPGGKLVYCTCSFAPEENEKIVSEFLEDHANARVLEIEDRFMQSESIKIQPGLREWKGKEFHPQVDRTIRIVPDEVMNGFYIALIGKDESI